MQIVIDLIAPATQYSNGAAAGFIGGDMTTIYIPIDDTVKNMIRQGYMISNVRLCEKVNGE